MMFAKSSLVAAVLALPSPAYGHGSFFRGGGQVNEQSDKSSEKVVLSDNAHDEPFVRLDSVNVDWQPTSKFEFTRNGADATSEDSSGITFNAFADGVGDEHPGAHRMLQQDRIMTLQNPCLEDIDVLLIMYQLPNGQYSGGLLNGGIPSQQTIKIGVRGLTGQEFFVYAEGSNNLEVKGDDSSICATVQSSAGSKQYCPAKVNGGSQLTYSFRSVCGGGGTGYSAPTTTTTTPKPASVGNGNNNSNRGACLSDSSSFNICIDAKSTGKYTSDWTLIADRAATKWEQVITGDLSPLDTRPQNVKAALAQFAGERLPDIIDDVYIKFKDVTIDGAGGVLGKAGPTYTRRSNGLPYNGVMEFDSGDIQWMLTRGQLEGVIAHEMGHVLGIGTLWSSQGLVGTSGTVHEGNGPVTKHVYNEDNGPMACRMWRETTGCGGCPPIENGGGPGTAGGHWDEAVMTNELMTGSTGGSSKMPLSKITAGTLEDLGYQVDYSKADPYTVTGQNKCGGRRGLRSTTTKVRQLKKGGHHEKVEGHHHKKKLSKAKMAAATEFGKEALAKAHADRPAVVPEGLVYVADKVVSVLIVDDDGEWYSVELTDDLS